MRNDNPAQESSTLLTLEEQLRELTLRSATNEKILRLELARVKENEEKLRSELSEVLSKAEDEKKRHENEVKSLHACANKREQDLLEEVAYLSSQVDLLASGCDEWKNAWHEIAGLAIRH